MPHVRFRIGLTYKGLKMVKKKCVVSITVEPELKKWLEDYSNSEHRSLSAQINYIIGIHREKLNYKPKAVSGWDHHDDLS